MRTFLPMAFTALCALAGCNADGNTRGAAGGSTTGSAGGGSAASSDDGCTVDEDCKRWCPAGAMCRCAIRHEQPGHCYVECPLEKSKITLGAACDEYSTLAGCHYGPDGKLGPNKGMCGYSCWREGWMYTDCDFAATCARTGGTPSSAVCCGDATDFPPACPEFNQCGCDQAASTAKVKTCQCPQGMCFDRVDGCHAVP